MSTPTGKPPENVSPTTTQHTPVIIKTGGDGVPVPTDMNVEIESSMMDFIASEPGPTWVNSQSALPGRLTEVSIREGKARPADYKIPPEKLTTTKELASLTIQYGSVQIRMWESIVPTDNNLVVLNIESDIPFNVAEENWGKADATFPPISSVEFSSGNRTIVNRGFKVTNPSIHINFDRTTILDG